VEGLAGKAVTDMTKKIQFSVFLIFLILLIDRSVTFPFQQEPAPVPPNIAIDPLDPSLPAEAKLLSGKWTGQWNSLWGWDCVLYVERIDKATAQVVHAWGEYNTSKSSCHCSPNWARVQRAKVTYSDKRAIIDFITPGYESGHFRKKKHTLSGEDEGWRGVHPKSHGHYSFSFTVEKSKPEVMKGRFESGKSSLLSIEMRKVD
jgi:hypothetical protein